MAFCLTLDFYTFSGWLHASQNYCFASAYFRLLSFDTLVVQIHLTHPDLSTPVTLFILDNVIACILAPYKVRITSQLYWHTLADDLSLALNLHKHQLRDILLQDSQ